MPETFTDIFHSAFTRRAFVLSLPAALGLSRSVRAETSPWTPKLDVFAQVTPEAGINTGVAFGDSIQKLIAAGALDPHKLKRSTNRLPDWVERLLTEASTEPIVFTRATAPYLVDLLWPVGLANRVAFNEKSPINTVSIANFASTGGWTLGREPNGDVYFNKVDAVRMTERQETAALDVATNCFRPCCDNSTFFQDCNHGSALLGLIELAASQGATAEAIYPMALAANAYWFPDQYAKTALSFWSFERRWWSDIAPRRLLGADFSSLSGWQRNVNLRLRRTGIDLPPDPRGQPACGI